MLNGEPIVTEEEIVSRRARRRDKGFKVLYTGSAIYTWQAIEYLIRLGELTETPVDMIFTGPDRVETMILKHPFS